MAYVKYYELGLQDLGLTELRFRPDRGSLFGNVIFEELYKNLGVIDQLFFWRTLSRSGVDFILTGDQKLAIEAKLSFDSQLRKPAGLRAFGKMYADFKQVVVTMDQFAFYEKVYYLPAWVV